MLLLTVEDIHNYVSASYGKNRAELIKGGVKITLRPSWRDLFFGRWRRRRLYDKLTERTLKGLRIELKYGW